MATQKEVAAALNLSTKQVQRLAKAFIIPPPKGSGGFDLEKCRDRYMEYTQALVEGRATPVDETDGELDERKERAKKLRLESERLEMELARERQEYIHVSVVGDLLEPLATTVASTLDTAVAVIRNRIPDLQARDMDIIKTEIAKARNGIAELRASDYLASDRGAERGNAEGSIAPPG